MSLLKKEVILLLSNIKKEVPAIKVVSKKSQQIQRLFDL